MLAEMVKMKSENLAKIAQHPVHAGYANTEAKRQTARLQYKGGAPNSGRLSLFSLFAGYPRAKVPSVTPFYVPRLSS